jgi:ABC-type spermidine/putrescine transport system permease subunit I
MGSIVYEQIFQNNNWPFAAAVSFILMAVTLAAFLLTRRLAGQEYLAHQQAFG